MATAADGLRLARPRPEHRAERRAGGGGRLGHKGFGEKGALEKKGSGKTTPGKKEAGVLGVVMSSDHQE